MMTREQQPGDGVDRVRLTPGTWVAILSLLLSIFVAAGALGTQLYVSQVAIRERLTVVETMLSTQNYQGRQVQSIQITIQSMQTTLAGTLQEIKDLSRRVQRVEDKP